MLNGRAICLGVLWLLFVAVVFGQQPPDSQVITVTGKIDLGKLNTTVGTLDTTVGKLDTTVGELSKTVTRGILGNPKAPVMEQLDKVIDDRQPTYNDVRETV